MLTLKTKDYPGFASASLDLCVPGRKGKPCGQFNRWVDVFVGTNHVTFTHFEWDITLEAGPKLRAAYMAARPTFGHEKFGPVSGAKELVRFVERAIQRQVARSRKSFRELVRKIYEAGEKQGRRDLQREIGDVLGISEC